MLTGDVRAYGDNEGLDQLSHPRGIIYNRSSRKHAYIILTPLNPTFI